MSTVVNIDDNKNEYRILCKGAPEVLKKFMTNVPNGYDKGYLKFVKNGARVLAMAYKVLPKMPLEQYSQIKREEAESDLIFCGFIIADCPLKPAT